LFPTVNKKTYSRIFSISGLLFLVLASLVGLASAAEPQWSYDSQNMITGLTVSGNGEYLAVGTSNNIVYFFNRSGSLLWTDMSTQKISSISLTTNGQYVGVGGTNLAVFNSNGGSVFKFNTGNQVRDVQFFPDGKYIAFMDLDRMTLFTREGGAVWTYSVKGDKTTREVEFGHHIAVSDDGSVIIFSPPWAKKLYCLAPNGNWKWTTPIDGFPLSVATSANGNNVLLVTDNKTISLISSEGKVLWAKNAFEPVTSAAMSSDGLSIVYGGKGNIVNFVRSDGMFQWKRDLFSPIDALAITGNGSYVVAGGADHKIHVFDTIGNEKWY
jgi:WD40 repeat protein